MAGTRDQGGCDDADDGVDPATARPRRGSTRTTRACRTATAHVPAPSDIGAGTRRSSRTGAARPQLARPTCRGPAPCAGPRSFYDGRRGCTLHRDVQLRAAGQRLQHDAVALRQLEERRELLVVGVGVELEAQADVGRSRPAPPCPRPACRGSRGRPRRGRGRSLTSMPRLVATAPSVTPAQATSASSSMSPEHSSVPSPPVAGCRPASAIARPVSTRAGDPLAERAVGLQRDQRLAPGRPCSGSFSGAWSALSWSRSMAGG